MTRGPSLARIAGAALLGAVLLAFVLHPLARLVADSLEGDAAARYARLFTSPFRRSAAIDSLLLAAASVVAAAAVGVPLAFAVASLGRAGRLLRAAALAPLLLSPVLAVLCFYFLFGRGGLIERGVGAELFEFRGFGAVLVVHAFTLFTYFFLFTAAALERFDVGQAEAARSLGASPARVFFTVVLPALRPALSGAAALTFMTSLASFTAPFVFDTGGRYLTTAITSLRQDDPAGAASVAVLLTAISLISVARTLRAPPPAGAGVKGIAAARAEPSGLRRLVRGALGAAVAATLLLPTATLALLSFKRGGRLGDEPLLSGLTSENYRAAAAGLFDARAAGPGAELLAAVGRSAAYSVVATLADAAFALALVLACVRAPKALRAGLEGAAMIPFAVPGTVLALALLAVFAAKGPLGIGPGLAGGVAILPIAYFVRNLPIVVRATSASMAQIPPSVPEAARGLGAGPLRAAATVVVPLLLPGLAAGALLAFVAAMGEFVASSLLYGPFTKPASVAIYDQFRAGDFGPAAAAGVLLAGATALALIAFRAAARALGTAALPPAAT